MLCIEKKSTIWGLRLRIGIIYSMSTFLSKKTPEPVWECCFSHCFVLVVYEIFWNIRALKAHLKLLFVTAGNTAFITVRENNKIMPHFCCYKWIINFEQKQSFRCHDIIINITPSDRWSYPGFHSQALWPSHLVVVGEGAVSPGRLLVARPARHGVGLPTKVLQVKRLHGESSSVHHRVQHLPESGKGVL